MDALGITPGMKVLDLGCGDGNTAVPIAQLGADVTGIDIAQNLVAAANLRANELKLSRLHFQEGDACNLEGVANGTFDLTVSFFGAMFAPQAARRRQRNGPRHKKRRPRGDGQLDSQRSHLGITGVKDPSRPSRLRTRRICQPHALGRRIQRDRTLRRSRHPAATNHHDERNFSVRLARKNPAAIHGSVPRVLRPHDERLRSRREKTEKPTNSTKSSSPSPTPKT